MFSSALSISKIKTNVEYIQIGYHFSEKLKKRPHGLKRILTKYFRKLKVPFLIELQNKFADIVQQTLPNLNTKSLKKS